MIALNAAILYLFILISSNSIDINKIYEINYTTQNTNETVYDVFHNISNKYKFKLIIDKNISQSTCEIKINGNFKIHELSEYIIKYCIKYKYMNINFNDLDIRYENDTCIITRDIPVKLFTK